MAESTPTIEMSESPEPKQLSSWRLRSPGLQNFIGAAVQGLCPGIYVSIVSVATPALFWLEVEADEADQSRRRSRST
jgi:hypothetical protein